MAPPGPSVKIWAIRRPWRQSSEENSEIKETVEESKQREQSDPEVENGDGHGTLIAEIKGAAATWVDLIAAKTRCQLEST